MSIEMTNLDKQIIQLENQVGAESGSTLASYISEVRKWPILTKEEEAEVWNNKTPKNVERLVNGHLRMVIAEAMKVMPYNHANEFAFMDLIQEGNLGLMKAVNTFDPSRGTKFSTHAYNWITTYIKNEMASQRCGLIKKPPHVLAAFNTLTKIEASLEEFLGRKPTEEEIITAVDGIFTPQRLHELLEAKNGQILSLDTTYGEEDDSTLADYIPDEDEATQTDVDMKEKSVMSVISSVLPPKMRLVIFARYGFGEFAGKKLTLKDIGQLFVDKGFSDKPVSQEWVRQLEEKAIETLKQNSQVLDLFGDM